MDDDRNFCTFAFLAGLAQTKAYFITRQHANIPACRWSRKRERVPFEGGIVFMSSGDDQQRQGRTLAVAPHRSFIWNRPTRDGDWVIAV